jgi:hypothetical protein
MKKLLIIISFFFICFSSFGQRLNKTEKRQEIEEKIKSLRVGYFTSKLDLTIAESEKFWPIFNLYESEKTSLFNEKKTNPKSFENDAQANAYIKSYFDIKEKELAIEKKYAEKFKTVLTAKKVATLFLLEKNFRQDVVSKIIEKRSGKRSQE